MCKHYKADISLELDDTLLSLGCEAWNIWTQLIDLSAAVYDVISIPNHCRTFRHFKVIQLRINLLSMRDLLAKLL
jgi:hypothetical protein